MPVYSRKWEQLGRNQIPLLMSWHNLQCNSGLLLAKHVWVFFPPEVLPSLSYRSNSLLLPLRTSTRYCRRIGFSSLDTYALKLRRMLVFEFANNILIPAIGQRQKTGDQDARAAHIVQEH